MSIESSTPSPEYRNDYSSGHDKRSSGAEAVQETIAYIESLIQKPGQHQNLEKILADLETIEKGLKNKTLKASDAANQIGALLAANPSLNAKVQEFLNVTMDVLERGSASQTPTFPSKQPLEPPIRPSGPASPDFWKK